MGIPLFLSSHMKSFHPGPHPLLSLFGLLYFLSAFGCFGADLVGNEKFKEDLVGRYDRSGSLESEMPSWPSLTLTNSIPEDLVGLSKKEAFDLLEEQLQSNLPAASVTLQYLYLKLFFNSSMALLTSPRVLNSEPIFTAVSRLLFYNMRRMVQAICGAFYFDLDDEIILQLIDNFWARLVSPKSSKLPVILRAALEKNRYVIAEEIILKFKGMHVDKIYRERRELLINALDLIPVKPELELIEQSLCELEPLDEAHELTNCHLDDSVIALRQEFKRRCIHLQEENAKFYAKLRDLRASEANLKSKIADLVNYAPNLLRPITHFLIRQQSNERQINDSLNLFKLLLPYGLEIEALDSLGRTPLHLAVFLNNKPFQEALLAAGADGNAMFGGFTAVAWADTAALDPSAPYPYRRSFPSIDQFLKRQEEAKIGSNVVRKHNSKEKNRTIAPFH